MSKCIIGKLQAKRLMEGRHVIAGCGRKFIASTEVKEMLSRINDNNLWDKYEIIIDLDEAYIIAVEKREVI